MCILCVTYTFPVCGYAIVSYVCSLEPAGPPPEPPGPLRTHPGCCPATAGFLRPSPVTPAGILLGSPEFPECSRTRPWGFNRAPRVPPGHP